jgi:hypothetical protein
MTPNVAELIRPTTVHAQLYTDPAIFDLEMDRIFRQGWVYVGHESELAKRGALSAGPSASSRSS